MSDPYTVLSSERGVVRVFTTELTAEGNAAVTPQNVHRLLGNDLDLDPSRVEVFPSTVLEAMGLSTYLQEGYGIPSEDLRGVRAALDSLKGLVILVASSAFRAKHVTLDPKPGVRFVGAFSEPPMAPPDVMTAPKASEGVLETASSKPLDQRQGSMWPIALLALGALLALVLFLVF